MVLDKSLDSIIAEKKKGKGKGRRAPRRSGGAAHTAKAKLVGKGGAAPVVAQRRAAAGAGPAHVSTAASSATMAVKIIISNLPADVNDAQVKDLFATTVGPVKTCSLQYNAAGKSNGTATVVFQKPGDAQKAFDTYNNRLIDGKRPMKIEIVFDPAKQPLVNRVAAPKGGAKTGPAASTVAAAGGGGGVRRPARRGRPGRGGGGGGGGAVRRPHKTAEDLDAEMADYTKDVTTTAATA